MTVYEWRIQKIVEMTDEELCCEIGVLTSMDRQEHLRSVTQSIYAMTDELRSGHSGLNDEEFRCYAGLLV